MTKKGNNGMQGGGRGERKTRVLAQQGTHASTTSSRSTQSSKVGKKSTKTKIANNDPTPAPKGKHIKTIDPMEDSSGSEFGFGNDVKSDSDNDIQYDKDEDSEDDDEEIDSDEAFGESDEERFADYVFRASKSPAPLKASRRSVHDETEEDGLELVLDEDSDEESGGNEDEDEDENDFENTEGAINLSDMLDRKVESDSGSDLDMGDDFGAENEEGNDDDDDDDDGDDGSVAGTSEEDNLILGTDVPNGDDPGAASKLISSVSALFQNEDFPQPASKRVRLDEAGSNSKRAKLTLSDLLPTLQDNAIKKTLSRLQKTPQGRARIGVPGKLAAPLPKLHQDRLDREEAFDKSKATLERWVDTVKHIREADHISFPLPDPLAPNAGATPSSSKLSRINASNTANELENKIAGILETSQVNGDKSIAEFEELATKKLSMKEVQARNTQLRMTREMLFREEVRAKRLKKIKSKAYRRQLKRERLKSEKSLLGEAENDDDGEGDTERERLRAQERMSLRHSQSRWAKDVRKHGQLHWNEDARDEASDMANRVSALKERMEGERGGENESDEEFSDEDDAQEQMQRLLNSKDAASGNSDQSNRLIGMKFMKDAEDAQKEENRGLEKELRRRFDVDDGGESDESIEDRGPRVGKRVFKDTLTNQNGSILLSQESMKDVVSQRHVISTIKIGSVAVAAINGRKTLDTHVDIASITPNPWMSAPDNDHTLNTRADKASKKRKAIEGMAARTEVMIDTQKSLTAYKTVPIALAAESIGGYDSDNSSVENFDFSGSGKTSTKSQPTYQDLVKRAFAGDEVVEDFAAEKEKHDFETTEKERRQNDFVPGWGKWAVTKKPRKEKETRSPKTTSTTARKARKEKKATSGEGVQKKLVAKKKTGGAAIISGPEKVIKSGKIIKKNVKYQASALPFPFESKQQYERSLRLPIGPEWSTKETYQSATTPRVLIKSGRAIEALSAPLV